MAGSGLYERVHPDGLDGIGGGRVDVHSLEAVFMAYYVRQIDSTRGMTRSEVVATLNFELVPPLRSEDLSDLDGMADTVDLLIGRTTTVGTAPNETDVNDAAVYIENLKWLNRELSRANPIVDETKWRNDSNL